MLYDPKWKTRAPPFVRGREGLKMLRDALRGVLPGGFAWDFSIYRDDFTMREGLICGTGRVCGTRGCALGLASFLWPEIFGLEPNSAKAAPIFEMKLQECQNLFTGVPFGMCADEVTEGMVADAIDRYLETGRVW